jgi:diguanylate cyclase (GGDEF)-like protein
MGKRAQVLAVARSADSLMTMQAHFRDQFELSVSMTWNDALDSAEELEPDIIIIDQDANHPEEGLYFAKRLREENLGNQQPGIILIHDLSQQDFQSLINESQADYIINAANWFQELPRVVGLLLKLKEKENEANQLARKLSLSQGKVKELQNTDSLTRLYNLPSITELLNECHRRCVRFHEPMAVLLVSIDHFIDYSHRKGPLYCIKILKQLSRILGEQLREDDKLGRSWGGEFIAILPETDLEGAILVATRIRDAVATASFGPKEDQVEVSLSQGIGTYNPFRSTPDTAEAMLLEAEEHLQEARLSQTGLIGFHKSVV